MSVTVEFSCASGIGRIAFNRPPANAYDLDFHRQFNAAIEQADADAATRVVIVHSAVPGFFSAGADVNAFAANSIDDNNKMVAAARSALARLESSDKPFIALVQGHTLGGGLEIAMACDMRFAAQGDYQLGLPEARLGLLPGNGGSQRLPRIVGASRALMLLTSGASIGPDEALRIGLIDRLCAASEVQAATEQFAVAITDAAPLAVAAAKRAVRLGRELPLADALALEAQLVDELYDSQDAKEGFAAATEKRAPNYKGR